MAVAKPMNTLALRRGPTGSPMIGTDNAVTMMGTVMKIALASASGMN